MKIEEIEKLLEKESPWELKKEVLNNKNNNIFIKLLSFFSILFSLSIIRELNYLGIEIYLVIIFAIFLGLLIIANEVIKINRLILFFSNNKSNENIIIGSITVILSIIVSVYGIYKFLDKTEVNKDQITAESRNIIADTTNYYNYKIKEIESSKITDVEPFKSEYTVYSNQLNQYNSDRDNYKNTSINNSNLRNYYKEINQKIDEVSNNIIILNGKFNKYKLDELSKLKLELSNIVIELESSSNESQSNFNTKNNIIIFMFMFFTLLTEFGIIFISMKISEVNIKNLEIKKHNDNIIKNKITHIKNSKEFKDFEFYKNIVERLLTVKSVNSTITSNEIKNFLNTDNLTTNQINKIVDDLRTFGIISQPVKRIGSKIQMNIDESIYTLRKYFEPYFKNY
jgi:hypothetical protein